MRKVLECVASFLLGVLVCAWLIRGLAFVGVLRAEAAPIHGGQEWNPMQLTRDGMLMCAPVYRDANGDWQPWPAPEAAKAKR